MLIHSRNILVTFWIESIICLFISDTHVWLRTCILWVLTKIFLFLSFFKRKEIDEWKFIHFFFLLGVKYFLEYFLLFNFPHVWTECFKCLIRSHWEPVSMIIWCSCTVLLSSQWWHFGVNKFTFVWRNHSCWIQCYSTASSWRFNTY